MALITRTQVIDSPVDEVFATVIDAGNCASWNPTIKASRRIDAGDVGDGSRFEWKLRGFGNVIQEFQEFEHSRRVRIVPQIKSLSGGHRFLFTPEGERTRVDHELEMAPRGVFRLLAPIMAWIGRRNLRDTAQALQAHLERAREGQADG
jgi:activator of HSP90 ATPase